MKNPLKNLDITLKQSWCIRHMLYWSIGFSVISLINSSIVSEIYFNISYMSLRKWKKYIWEICRRSLIYILDNLEISLISLICCWLSIRYPREIPDIYLKLLNIFRWHEEKNVLAVFISHPYFELQCMVNLNSDVFYLNSGLYLFIIIISPILNCIVWLI